MVGEALEPTPEAPRFTIITAVHNVARYLPDFIDSIEKQTFDLSRVEVIAVDDGSTDDSLVVLKEWAARRPHLVTVLSQPNGGQGSARNSALAHAAGEWITFPDPDDILRPTYLSEVNAFLVANPTTMMTGSNRLIFMENTGTITDSHPMRRMYTAGNRLIDIDKFPDYSQNSAATGFFRREVIEREKLRFDTRIRPVFEDGHFCICYLLACEQRLIGFIRTADYVYRKRGDNSSTLQNSVSDPDRYIAVPKYGYLDVLRRSVERHGRPPEWLQNMVIYDVTYYFSADLAMSGASGAKGEVADEFVGYLKEIVSYLEPVMINGYKTKHFDRLWRDICLHGLGNEKDWHTPYVVTTMRDSGKQLVRLAYRYLGEPPTEEFFSTGETVEAVHAKIRSHEFFERTLMYERIVWVPLSGTLRVELNGEAVSIQPGWEPTHNTTVRDWQVRDWFEADERGVPPRRPKVPASEKSLVPLSKTPAVRAQFRDAWVILDRLHDADDNGERLFRYIHDNRPDINAWFVIERGTPDWKKLHRDGYGNRVIAYGSTRWKLLMLNCVHLISSHADAAVLKPPGAAGLNRTKWNVSFLQHGVIKDDLSRWLNPKQLDLFVTSTPQEQESIAGDFNSYVYCDREARMTGLPRFDRLLELGSKVPVENRKWLLVCPTWRHWLNPPPKPGTQRHEIGEAFFSSEYAQRWTEFLSDPRLGAMAKEHNLRIGFLPHPNIQPALARMALPSHVEALTFVDNDVQQLMADSALMVTDYSSMAFNAAYLDRPVVYFQFDAERMKSGDHVGRPGYFSYERDGFGPVTTTVGATVDAVIATVVDDAKVPNAEYQRRINETFTERDGRCCERTVAAIEDLSPKVLPPDRMAEFLRSVRANPRVQRVVRSPRGREVVPKLKELAKSSGATKLLKQRG